MEEMMKILVIGATGPTGREIVSRGLAIGHEIAALVRSKRHRAFPAGTGEVLGDVMNPASLEAVVRGHEAVISSLGTRKIGPTTLFSEGTRNLICGMKAAGVNRLVCITGVGAGDSRGHGGFLYDMILQPLVLRHIYANKDRQEAIIQASGLDWTIVRPGRLTNGRRTETYRELYNLAHIKMSTISRSDVADSILKHIEDPGSHHRTYNLTY
jgi:putative NADH-flavin reductase